MQAKPRGNNPEALEVGDVVLDLAQGRPMQIVGRYDGDVREWSAENDYDLTGNYGNSRFEAEESEAVFDCVYVGSIQSEPSKTYAFPTSRLARIEVEAAEEELLRVGDEIRQAFLTEILLGLRMDGDPSNASSLVRRAAEDAGLPQAAIEEAAELAETTFQGRKAEQEAAEQTALSDDPGAFGGSEGAE